MPRPPSSIPTEVELAILHVLWQKGSSTVRQIHNSLKEERGTGYSTTLKMIQVMTEKGLVLKDESQRPQVYRPAKQEEHTQLQLVDDLIQRGFSGSAMKLVLSAVSAKRISADEMKRIRELLKP
jgi:BlaI family transcriptional regulator, penicillinase repressor